jgi:hypothetical protein
MRPIPLAFLQDSCVLKTVFINGETSETALSHVRIEISKTADKYRCAEGTLWYDCKGSTPASALFALRGEAINGQTVRRQFIIKDEEEIEITGVSCMSGGSAPHHYEIKLGGVIPYNG